MNKILFAAISACLIFVSSVSQSSILDNSKYEVKECPATVNIGNWGVGKFHDLRLERFQVECFYKFEKVENDNGVRQGFVFRNSYEEYFKLDGILYKDNGSFFVCETNSRYNPADCKFKLKRVDSK